MTAPRDITDVTEDLPSRSILLDRDGDAWQLRYDGQWWLASAVKVVGAPLAHIVALCGPLTLIWEPTS